jgi:hypothetical protein
VATPDQVAIIRSWVGSGVDLDALGVDDRLARLASSEAVALELLRLQLADLVASPTKLDVDGDVSVDWSANIAALRARISELEAVVADQAGIGQSSVTVATLRRAGRRR